MIFDKNEVKKGIHILESIIAMTKQLLIPIIVEGVETNEQIEFLYDLGCRYVQGYYFYKPMPTYEFEKLIYDGKILDTNGITIKLNQQFNLREFLNVNIYSDLMLNNILGAVAFYYWHGEDVDIVRFNQQFYESVNVPDFHEKLIKIQNVMPEDDVPKLYALLQEAKDNALNGSTGILHFYKYDGKFYERADKESFFLPFKMKNDEGNIINLQMKMDPVDDKISNISFILTFRIENN